MTENTVSQKPVGVMISNSSIACLSGASPQADVIFEMIAEGPDPARFLALFQDPSSVEALGSVRSARPYFIDMAGALTPCTSISAAVCPPMKRSPGSEKKGLIAMDGIRDGWEGNLFVRDPSRRKGWGWNTTSSPAAGGSMRR